MYSIVSNSWDILAIYIRLFKGGKQESRSSNNQKTRLSMANVKEIIGWFSKNFQVEN